MPNHLEFNIVPEVAELKPGGTYAIRVRGPLPPQAMMNIKQQLENVEQRLGIKVLLLSSDMEMVEVKPLGAEEIEAAVQRAFTRALQDEARP
jgi:hypothetical protein